MTEPLVAAILVRRLVDQLVELGAPREELLARAGVPAESLGLARLRLPWAYGEALLEAAEDLTGDDRVGLHLARPRDLEAVALPGMLFFASGTLGQAITRMARFSRLWTSAIDCGLDSAAAPPRYRFELRRPFRRASVHVSEEHLASGIQVARRALGGPVVPLEVRFAHPRAGEVSEYEAFFQCPVRFGAGENAILLAPEVLARPVVTASPLFAEHFEAQARRELAALGGGQTVVARVREVLEEALADHALGGATLASTARRLRTSPRTLQRALSAEGTSFAEQVDTLRRGQAEALLAAGADIAEVSWRLGYAEPAVFHRAFKRWTGGTPDSWRAARGR